MRNYSNELHSQAVTNGKDVTDEKSLMGEVYDIYYGNRDLRSVLCQLTEE